jgi:hypothetical protein
MMKHHEIMRKVKLERDAREEERRRQEHERLLVTTSVAEQPFLFLADELVLLIFSSLSARDLCLASRVCKRYAAHTCPFAIRICLIRTHAPGLFARARAHRFTSVVRICL